MLLLQDPEQDLHAARWWEEEAAPTTNDARNSDVDGFWHTATDGDAAAAIKDLTGRRQAPSTQAAYTLRPATLDGHEHLCRTWRPMSVDSLNRPVHRHSISQSTNMTSR